MTRREGRRSSGAMPARNAAGLSALLILSWHVFEAS